MIERAVEFLLSTQNPDGGWGAEDGKRSNTEATSFCLLALSVLRDKALAGSVKQGLNWLINQQNADGSWPLTANVKDGSWTTALAVLSLAPFEAFRPRALRGARWLLRREGEDLGWVASVLYRLAPQMLAVQLNPDLKGWPWTSGTFSWVEPTSYALIALKKLRPDLRATQVEERIHEGELVLYDRVCKRGGWNYGNTKTLGMDLSPYPDLTALALIALQDHQAAGANQSGLSALRKMLTHVESGLAVSWSILCFSLYGHDVSRWRARLARVYEKRRFLGQTKTFALALLALGDGLNVLRV